MSVRTLPPTNGSTPHLSDVAHALPADSDWLQLSTQNFFSRFNWDDNPPEVQQLRQDTAAGSTAPLSMTLTVSQFFGAINWDGEAIASSAAAQTSLDDDLSGNDIFTLDEFSNLF